MARLLASEMAEKVGCAAILTFPYTLAAVLQWELGRCG
jgi:hypothetical protein